jgi:hypothetical protein
MSDDPHLVQSVVSVLGSDSRFIVTAGGLHCDGSAAPLTNIYPSETADDDWTDWSPGDSGMVNPQRMSSLIFETRSPAWVAEVGVLLARGLKSPAWFVDSADFAWPVGAVDADRIALI